jgi:hypothetical protein
MELLKRSLLRGLAFSGIASAAIYVIALAFFTIHEELGVPAREAFPIAAWAFPVLLLVSAIFFAVKGAGERKR